MIARGLGVRRMAILALTVSVLGAAACGDDSAGQASGRAGENGAGDGSSPSPPPASPGTSQLEAQGIEIDAPPGWQEVALPALGFGVAMPEGWEAVVLSEEGLETLRNASPVVPHFTASATAAARAGAVFYAAGVADGAGDGPAGSVPAEDPEGDASAPVVDLKVRVDTASGVQDMVGLEDYARQTAGALPNANVGRVADAPYPTVDVRYRDPTVRGTERVVLAPSGAVYSFIVTSEDAATHDEIAPALLATVAFPPP
jgi:hypothetical protein